MQRRLVGGNQFERLVLVIVFFAFVVPAIAADVVCGPANAPGFGPYDYREAPADKLAQVEKYHFTTDVQALRRGESSENIGKDLEFVLRYFPNHSRALNAMVQLAKRERTNRPRGNRDSVECWFDRAVKFQPGDGTVRLLFSLWLSYRGDKEAAITHLQVARDNAKRNDANYVYNLGLAYLEVGDYEHALQAAHQAYALGYPLPGLRDRLTRLGRWRAPSAGAGPHATVPSPQNEGATDPGVKK